MQKPADLVSNQIPALKGHRDGSCREPLVPRTHVRGLVSITPAAELMPLWSSGPCTHTHMYTYKCGHLKKKCFLNCHLIFSLGVLSLLICKVSLLGIPFYLKTCYFFFLSFFSVMEKYLFVGIHFLVVMDWSPGLSM